MHRSAWLGNASWWRYPQYLVLSPEGRKRREPRADAAVDEQYTRTPFYGIRRMTAWLRSRGTRSIPSG